MCLYNINDKVNVTMTVSAANFEILENNRKIISVCNFNVERIVVGELLVCWFGCRRYAKRYHEQKWCSLMEINVSRFDRQESVHFVWLEL